LFLFRQFSIINYKKLLRINSINSIIYCVCRIYYIGFEKNISNLYYLKKWNCQYYYGLHFTVMGGWKICKSSYVKPRLLKICEQKSFFCAQIHWAYRNWARERDTTHSRSNNRFVYIFDFVLIRYPVLRDKFVTIMTYENPEDIGIHASQLASVSLRRRVSFFFVKQLKQTEGRFNWMALFLEPGQDNPGIQ